MHCSRVESPFSLASHCRHPVHAAQRLDAGLPVLLGGVAFFAGIELKPRGPRCVGCAKPSRKLKHSCGRGKKIKVNARQPVSNPAPTPCVCRDPQINMPACVCLYELIGVLVWGSKWALHQHTSLQTRGGKVD